MTFFIDPYADEFSFLFTARARRPNEITGTSQADQLSGTAHGDLIRGLSGKDEIDGAGGNDRLLGGSGNDRLNGDRGNDRLFGGAGKDRLDGGDGNDRLFGGAGRDRLNGDRGRDILDGGGGDDILRGGGGNDTFILSPGADRIVGGAGMDTLDASEFSGGVVVNTTAVGQGWPSIAPGTITLGDGTVQNVSGIENFVGSGFDDKFFSSAARAVIKGGKGADTLQAFGTDARVVGGKGDDWLQIRGESSKAKGGAGDDRIDAFGVDLIALGGRGNDIISIAYASTIPPDAPQNIIRGGAGNDRIIWLSTDGPPDRFAEPAMLVFGGAGADVFDFGFYEAGTIQDFQPGVDKVDLSVHLNRENTDFAELMTMMADTAKGAVLTLDYSTVSGFNFVFKGVQVADFVNGDFIF